jgi:DDE superfamily endonuclease
MTCPHCESTATPERSDRTALGYRRFRRRDCSRILNERTGTLFNRLQYPTDVLCLVVFWRFQYKLSLRDLAEMFLQPGITFTHEAVREWEAKLAPLLGEALRKRRHGAVGQRWYVDETYVRVQGKWQYLYQAFDRDGVWLKNLELGVMHHSRHGGQDLADVLLRSGSQGRLRQAHAEAHQSGDDRDKRGVHRAHGFHSVTWRSLGSVFVGIHRRSCANTNKLTRPGPPDQRTTIPQSRPCLVAEATGSS